MANARTRLRRGEGLAGWLFTAPVIVILGLFLLVPVLMAAWVSLSDWTGRGSPFAAGVNFIGVDNYREILGGGGLAERDFGISLKNNFWYVILVVPLQTIVALGLALLVNKRVLRGRGFFRTAFYFPSVTSSVAITVLWLFLFSGSGAVNAVLSWVGINGPDWFNDPAGIFHFGATSGPSALTSGTVLGVSWWDWLGGPSVAMTAFVILAVFTTGGTFMLLFLAALQNLSGEVQEAAEMDGANAAQRFFRVTLPQLRPTLFTVITLGLIGCWQVFDQIYTGTQGQPGKTTLTPAYLSYTSAFDSNEWGRGAAIAFILFAIIIVFTLVQRWVLAERKVSRRRMRWIEDARDASARIGGTR
ncbi:carbohydrate ABC transporter permease [Schumannella soli]|uniref:Sugar ABC transporter permease n=1 Tax=Schumannella soli TaxID=2590779 RepID=A0A506Y4S5_9MICO|nr:sugar ABC transporter permease [Schumannella soli]TPW77596.1 sugar ABC transporter permease [Schumannella soli]